MVAGYEAGVIGLDNFANRPAHHDVADIHGIRVRSYAGDAAAHVGIDREVLGLDQDLAFAGNGHGCFYDREIGFFRHPYGTSGELELTICAGERADVGWGHGSLIMSIVWNLGWQAGGPPPHDVGGG